jgi:hypothetical protein
MAVPAFDPYFTTGMSAAIAGGKRRLSDRLVRTLPAQSSGLAIRSSGGPK